MVPDSHKVFPEGQVGPDGLGEEDDDGGETEHLPHREDELLGLLWHHLIQTAHAGLKQHRTDPCSQDTMFIIYRICYSCHVETTILSLVIIFVVMFLVFD